MKAVIIILLTIIAVPLVVLLFSFNYNSNSGTHKGFITAVDQSGIFFRNYKVYFKTNPQSSQEDLYCVRSFDNELGENLRKAQSEGREIVIHYDGDKGFGLGQCGTDRIRSFENKQ